MPTEMYIVTWLDKEPRLLPRAAIEAMSEDELDGARLYKVEFRAVPFCVEDGEVVIG